MNRELRLMIITLLIGYNLFPLLLSIIPGSGDWGFLLSMVGLYFVNGFLSFASGLVYSLRHGWQIWLPALVGVLFLPTMLIFYNSSAVGYLVGYMVIAIFGMLLGSFGGRGIDE